MRAKVFTAILLALLLLVSFWLNGSIPELVARSASTKYVKTNYGDMGLVFDKIEYSTSHGNYFAYFIDKDGNKYAFMLSPGKFWPAQVWHDPIDPTRP